MLKYVPVLAGLMIVLMLGVQCSPDPHTEGKQLAEAYCTGCHMLPDPDLLTREIWTTEVLPLMGAFYGIYDGNGRQRYLKSPQEAAYLQEVYPEQPTIDREDWAKIVAYYAEAAPTEMAPPGQQAQLMKMSQFKVREIRDSVQPYIPPFATSITYHEEDREVYVASLMGQFGVIRKFNEDHDPRYRGRLPSPLSDYDPLTDSWLHMGSLVPSDLPQGSCTTDDRAISELKRPMDLIYCDLDLDGEQELIIAEYGNMTGQLSRRVGDRSEVLSATPGALRLRVADMDGDGHDDLIALFAQGDERVEVYYARQGKPERQRLLRFPSSYGSADLQVVDFDGDGDLDLLHACGDNYDYQPIPKNYHGLRVYLNDGKQQFEEAFFYHLDGAYGLEVDDFDGDGDQDIAAIAYFVPPVKRPLYSFVYLEQTGDMTFTPQGIHKKRDQHFICMTSADVDRDGDRDLLVGNFAGYLPDGPPNPRQIPKDAPVYLLFENQ